MADLLLHLFLLGLLRFLALVRSDVPGAELPDGLAVRLHEELFGLRS